MAKRTERKSKAQRKRAKNTPVMFRLAPGQLAGLNAIAERQGIPRNSVACAIFDHALGIDRGVKGHRA